MSLVTAAIRPSGASYREDLLAHKQHHNPSPIIDELLSDNLGRLVYQEDTLRFLQQICGLSGSEADNIRRAIGRKQKDRLEKSMPSILEGYCAKSNQPREIAEEEAKEFLQVIEDSASYQFGYNHSIGLLSPRLPLRLLPLLPPHRIHHGVPQRRRQRRGHSERYNSSQAAGASPSSRPSLASPAATTSSPRRSGSLPKGSPR